MTDFQTLFDQFQKSLQTLKDVIREEETVFIRDSAIQRFEYTFELAWKSLKSFLASQGILVNSPREAIKEAYAQSIIEYDTAWLEIIELRNLTSHTYKEELAKQVFAKLSDIVITFETLEKNLEKKLNDIN